MYRLRTHRCRSALCALVLIMAAGCASENPVLEGSPEPIDPEPSTLDVSAIDDGDGGGYGFTLASTVQAGPTRINLRNEGAEPHHAQLFRLDDESTLEDLGAQLATGDYTDTYDVGFFDGGTGTVDPGGEASATGLVDLTEGTYVFMCFVENAEGPHVANGMLQPFEVTGSADSDLPAADQTATLTDFAFGLPAAVEGDAVIEVDNQAETEIHEMNFLRVGETTTTEDVMDFFTAEGPPSGPPPFSSVGGLQAIMPGDTRSVQLDLEPGTYMVICLIPTISDGVPHAVKGMIQPVTIE